MQRAHSTRVIRVQILNNENFSETLYLTCSSEIHKFIPKVFSVYEHEKKHQK